MTVHQFESRNARILAVITAIVVTEAVLALGVFGVAGEPPRGGDSRVYLRMAESLLNGHGLSAATSPPFDPSAYHPPGYPVFLALVKATAGDNPDAVRVAQFGLLILLAMLVYSLARETVGTRPAGIAAITTALYAPFVGFATAHLAELLGTVLLAATMLALVRALESASVRMYVVAGVGLALVAMTRSAFALLLIPLALAALFDATARRLPYKSLSRYRGTAILVAVFCAVSLPWAARNIAVTDHFIPFATNAGESLFLSARQYSGEMRCAPERLVNPEGSGLREPPLSSPSCFLRFSYIKRLRHLIRTRISRDHTDGGLETRIEVTMYYELRDQAMQVFSGLGLWDIVGDIPMRERSLWSTAAFRFSETGFKIARLQHYLLLTAAIAGAALLAVRRHAGYWWILLIPILYVSVLHLIFHVVPRYSIPTRPFLIILAAYAAWALLAAVGVRPAVSRLSRRVWH